MPADVVLFPDTTVLVNFAIIGRLDLLEALVNGKGRWALTVARECSRSARTAGLEALATAGDIFGAPLTPDARELIQTKLYRERLASPGDDVAKHIGESETLAIITTRSLSALFVTDDGDAAALAIAEGVRPVTTCELLRAGCRAGTLENAVAYGYVKALKAARRRVPPGLDSQEAFDKWVAS